MFYSCAERKERVPVKQEEDPKGIQGREAQQLRDAHGDSLVWILYSEGNWQRQKVSWVKKARSHFSHKKKSKHSKQ